MTEKAVGFNQGAPDQPPEAKASTDRDQLIRRAYTMATQALRDVHPDEFNDLRKRAAKELGFEWEPRPNRDQKARAELDRLLAEHPDLIETLAERLAERGDEK